jgi:hypothetical protein
MIAWARVFATASTAHVRHARLRLAHTGVEMREN